MNYQIDWSQIKLEQIKDIDFRAWFKEKKIKMKTVAAFTGVLTALTIIILSSFIDRPEKQEFHSPIPLITNTPTPTVIKKQSWKGYVSHYSRTGCLGCSENLTMANGQPLDDNKLTIAFNWLPMNTEVRLTNLDNGKSIVATVTDTGGFNSLNRIADLVPAVANYLETKTDRSIVLIEEL